MQIGMICSRIHQEDACIFLVWLSSKAECIYAYSRRLGKVRELMDV